jgi:hypothetical protein
MQVIAVVDPFTYAVHAFKRLRLKNTGFGDCAARADRLRPALSHRVFGRRDDSRHGALPAHSPMSGNDGETRTRVLAVATRLFAAADSKK